MQQPTSGKLDNIKNLKESLAPVSGLLDDIRGKKAELEQMVSSLRSITREISANRAEKERRAEKEKEFEELKKQRAQERMDAETKIDQMADSFRKKEEAKKQADAEAKAARTEGTETQPAGKPPVKMLTPSAPQKPKMLTPSPRPAGAPAGRTFVPGSRSPYQGRSFVPGGGAQGGFNNNRPGFPPRDGQRTPFGGQRPGFNQGGAGGQRPGGFGAPRPQFGGNAGGAPRPGMLPRPTMNASTLAPKTNTFDNRKKGKFEGERTGGGMDRRALLRRGIVEERDIEDRMLTRVFRTKKAKDGAEKAAPKAQSNIIKIETNTVTVKALSEKIGKIAPEIIKQLIVLGEMATINSVIDFATAELVAGEFGFVLELHADKSFEEKMSEIHKNAEDEKDLASRPPVVTVMGHVDHGKTSLLDALRKTRVTAGESGGITQHLGAYQVSVKGKKLTFIDTPGHAAFDKMRARGAQVTDIAILLVAGDDGVMPQTVEAIKHIQSQNIPMIVAVNKMDKKEFDIERVKTGLSQHNVIPREWGGDVELVPISALSNQNLDKLLEEIIVLSEVNEYKANPNKEASGFILEAQLDKARGAVVTMLVQNGTLKVGDTLLAGTAYGKVRSLMDERGKSVRKATPSMPVQVLGFGSVPKAGDAAYVVDEKLTKQVVQERIDKQKRSATTRTSTTLAADAFDAMHEAEKTQLNIIVKGDVAGSVEAIIQTLGTITSDEVSVNVISSGVGAINDNDVALAEMSGARLIAFHTKVTPSAKVIAKKAKIHINEFKIIYQIFDFVTLEMVKMFKPKFVDKYVGKAEVKKVFKSSSIGLIAGSQVMDGKVMRGNKAKLIRGGKTISEHKIDTLKINQNDAKEVASGFECGIKLDNNPIVMEGDIIESYIVEQLPIMFQGKKFEF